MKLAPLPELACREVVELLTEYLSGALSADDLLRVQHHLGDCSPCRHYLAQLEATIRLTGELRGTTGGEVSESLLDAFRAIERG